MSAFARKQLPLMAASLGLRVVPDGTSVILLTRPSSASPAPGCVAVRAPKVCRVCYRSLTCRAPTGRAAFRSPPRLTPAWATTRPAAARWARARRRRWPQVRGPQCPENGCVPRCLRHPVLDGVTAAMPPDRACVTIGPTSFCRFNPVASFSPCQHCNVTPFPYCTLCNMTPFPYC